MVCKTNHDPKRLRADADRLEAALDALPKIEGPDFAAARMRYHDALDQLVDVLHARTDGPTIRQDGMCTSIRWRGIRSTSTSGAEGAIRNWIIAARKIAAGES